MTLSAWAHVAEIVAALEWRANVVRDPEVSRLDVAYSESKTGELDREDTFRLQLLLTSLWGVYETAFYSRDHGLLGPAEWGRYEIQMCEHQGLNVEEWNHIVAPRITEPFRRFLEASCRR
jgi:hypothetical protein